jgi:hypothetical protein
MLLKFIKSKDEGRKLEKIIEAIEKDYDRGTARHAQDMGNSVFRILSYDDYRSLSPRRLASLLEDHHIVVKDMPLDCLKFDEGGLQTLCPLYSTIEMQGA